MRLLKFHNFCFRKVFKVSRVPIRIFKKFCNRMDVKKISKGPPSQFSTLSDFSQWIIFVLNLGFLRPSTLCPILFFFKDRCFYASFFLICFYRSSPQFLLETKRFASIKNCSRFSALCDLPENFSLKVFRKVTNFILIFCFFLKNVFGSERWFFCCFQLKKNGFRDLCVSFRVFLAL